ncbi:MAG TPA: alkyl sulfatase dimerization domain-containing protein [Solimonas sp.]|nr:alkyl sulfatase dimerization domain-containing protein [Solimonas sp.]
MKTIRMNLAALLLAGLGGGAALAQSPAEAPAATPTTRAANAAVLKELPFADISDFANARRGYIAPLPEGGVIRTADGREIWNLGAYQYGNDQPAPDTVNPSLWRQQQLLAIGGLFEVVPGIYQVRSADVSNLTIVEGKTGLIIIDPVLTTETAKAGLDLYRAHRGSKPVVAVIYTHSHIDHFGGVRAVVDEADVKAGKVQIIAPEHFVHEAVSENVNTANHMTRRASYQFGNLLPKSATGSVTSGLGLGTPAGTITMIRPTREIGAGDQTVQIDGLTFDFLLAPASEAPAEMHFYIREYKALTAAENANHTMHNIQTLRGAKPRDALGWARVLNTTLTRWGAQAEVLYGPHHWPVWGADVVKTLQMQRDLYKYLNDQTLRLANHGYNKDEAAELVALPDELAQFWANRGYYGTVSHNVKGVWAYYLGWFDGNPATLQPLPPQMSGRKFVEYMGGADRIMAKARKDYAAGEYRWVAQVLDTLVAAQPENQAARKLLADALTQMGYQAESGIWRNFYLTGAKELREGVNRNSTPSTGSPDLLRALTVEQLFDVVAIRLNGPKAQGHRIAINIAVTDLKQDYGLVLENAVLNTVPPVATPDLSLALPKDALLALLFGKAKLPELVKGGVATVSGDATKLGELAGLLDTFDLWWNVATPRALPAAP